MKNENIKIAISITLGTIAFLLLILAMPWMGNLIGFQFAQSDKWYCEKLGLKAVATSSVVSVNTVIYKCEK